MTRASDEWYETALDLREAGELNEAIVAASAALGEDGSRVDARHILGAVLLEAGHLEAATAELSRVKAAYQARIAARSDDKEAWYQLGCVRALMNEDAEALASLKQAFALENAFHAHPLRSRAREDKDLARLLEGGDALDRLVPELPDTDERARLFAIFEAARPVFDRVERFDYYLANAIGSSFLLPAANVAEAHRRMSANLTPIPLPWPGPPADEAEAARRRRLEAGWERLHRERRAGKATLDELFAAHFMTLVHDSPGSIVDITGQDGDVCAVDLLEEMADLVTDGSWFLYLDDVGRYWRARVASSQLIRELARGVERFEHTTRARSGAAEGPKLDGLT